MTERIKRYAKDKSGFSFVELMVVIALIGILSGIALPSFLRGLPEKRLKNAARNLYSDLQRARLQAVKENKGIRVRFSDNTDNKNDFYYFDINDNGIWDAIEFRRNLSETGAVGYGFGSPPPPSPSVCGSTPSSSCVWNTENPNTCTLAPVIMFGRTGGSDAASIFLADQSTDVCYAATTTDFGSVRLRRYSGSSWE